jgi:L-threonylcarbamoyladenylate synthase
VHLTDDTAAAAAALAAGHLAAVPTETVYGLGARADDPHAVARVYAAKGRPADHPLIVHVRDADAAWQWAASVPDFARDLAARHWPGPLTLVLERSARAGDFVTGGQDTVAVRVPAHPVFRAVLDELAAITGDPAVGVAAPSANRFGRVSPTTVQHVTDELGALLSADDVVLDGGASDVGVESTIVDCTGDAPVILRPGRVSHDDVSKATGLVLGHHSPVRAPGTLAAHYAPTARVIVVDAGDVTTTLSENDVTSDVTGIDARTGLLALAAVPTPAGIVRLAAPSTADDYARVLYSALREADALQLTRVFAVAPPPDGVGAAVADRLRRAAAS